jgi:Bacterial archaeo-eukaryotic release factor family 3
MIMFSRSDLDELVAVESHPAVSLYLPTHVAGREIRQDPIRLKNLLSSAAERLAATWRRPEIEELLEPAAALVGDEEFWRHQRQGLAVFLAPGFARVHKLPVPVPEETLLADHFHIKPLLPLLEDAGLFWLLTISAKHTGLYRASRWEFAEDQEIDLPQGVGKIRGMTDYEETQYASPVGRRGTLAHAQSFGEAPEELRKSELIEFLHRVAAGVQPRLKGNPAPVILAAHPEIQGHFREIAGWKEIQSEGISENPDALTEDELHHRGYALVEPKLAEGRAAGVDRLNASLAAGKAATRPEEIVKAARYARVDTLFLTGDDHLWGRFDESEDRVVAHGSAGEGDIDLLDFAALMTLRHGGSVMLVERAALPPPGLSAAILRY